MRVDMSNGMTPGIIVHLDGELVAGCFEADDVEGWVRCCRIVPGTEKDPVPRYLQGQDGPLTEVVHGKVEFQMLEYTFDEKGNVETFTTIPMDWDKYIEQRKQTFRHIHKNDSIKLRNVMAMMDEWYGKAKTQDAEARQRKQKDEKGSEGQEEDEGEKSSAPGSGDGAGTTARQAGRPPRKSATIGKGGS